MVHLQLFLILNYKIMTYTDFPVTVNFMFSELIHTNVNVKAGNVPTDINVLFNLYESARKLQMLRDSVFNLPIRINSGYRSFVVNQAVGGVRTSDHLKGLAFDIVVDGLSSYDVFTKLFNYHLNSDDWIFGQVICYPTFIHVSFNRENHKDEFFCKDLL